MRDRVCGKGDGGRSTVAYHLTRQYVGASGKSRLRDELKSVYPRFTDGPPSSLLGTYPEARMNRSSVIC
jgi:hypothetical protein